MTQRPHTNPKRRPRRRLNKKVSAALVGRGSDGRETFERHTQRAAPDATANVDGARLGACTEQPQRGGM